MNLQEIVVAIFGRAAAVVVVCGGHDGAALLLAQVVGVREA